MEELIKLMDGAILKIEQDKDYEGGCATCDYGSKYVNKVIVKLTRYMVKTELSQKHEYILSNDDMMKLFISNLDMIKKMTEKQFTKWFVEKMKEFEKDLDYEVTKIKGKKDGM